VFFSAHGVPKSYVEEAGDPYKEEMEECVALIMAELQRRGRGNEHTLAYQSRVGPVEWLQPYTDDSIRCAHGAGACSSSSNRNAANSSVTGFSSGGTCMSSS
jgi:ferrochelatase